MFLLYDWWGGGEERVGDCCNHLKHALRPFLKIWLFWSNPYKNEAMITCFVEMLDILNFGHRVPTAWWQGNIYNIN